MTQLSNNDDARSIASLLVSFIKAVTCCPSIHTYWFRLECLRVKYLNLWLATPWLTMASNFFKSGTVSGNSDPPCMADVTKDHQFTLDEARATRKILGAMGLTNLIAVTSTRKSWTDWSKMKRFLQHPRSKMTVLRWLVASGSFGGPLGAKSSPTWHLRHPSLF